MRGGLYPDDIILKNAAGVAYEPVETQGYSGCIFESSAGKVKPDVEAYTTAVFEVHQQGETGLKLVYHAKAEDGFTCEIGKAGISVEGIEHIEDIGGGGPMARRPLCFRRRLDTGPA